MALTKPLGGEDDPRHGTTSAYDYYGCRCDRCRTVGTAKQRRMSSTPPKLDDDIAELAQRYMTGGPSAPRKSSAMHIIYTGKRGGGRNLQAAGRATHRRGRRAW